MAHKQRCIDTCMEYLEGRNLSYTFNQATFNHYYRKHNGAWGNAYSVGLSAGDMMIANFPTTIKNIKDETRNDNETGNAQRA